MGKTLHNVPTLTVTDSDHVTGRGDPQQRFRIYRLCNCEVCGGTGKAIEVLPKGRRGGVSSSRSIKCPECRGEGKTLDLVACCADPQGVGVTIITLGAEGEFEDCPIGILEDGGSWLVKPWLPSPRNVADAARVLAKSKGEK